MNDDKLSADFEPVDATDDVETLREALSNGAFGEEDASVGNDAVADDAVIDGFISMFGATGNTPLKAHDWVVYFPSSLINKDKPCQHLHGIVREETETIYVLDYPNSSQKYESLGEITIAKSEDSFSQVFEAAKAIRSLRDQLGDDYICCHARYMLSGSVVGDRFDLELSQMSQLALGGSMALEATIPLRVKLYDTVTNLFSRNTGLLESSAMLDKRAVLVGCGSVGSFVAMQLARSGVGKFVLCDTDTLEIHNICRHQCGFDDLGRYKVDAVKDKILNINPNAEVITYRSIIQRVPEDELLPLLGRNTIIIGGGDNRGSADWSCKLAIKTDSTFVSTGCWTRAFAGEIFYWASGRNLSCYSCALGGLIDEDRPESHATYFGSDEEKESLSFEPGIAADIDFVTLIAVKLALDLLNRDNEHYTPRVINHLKQYTWVCNTNNTNIGGPRAAMFPTPLWITNNLSVNKGENCPYCSNK